MGSAFLVVGLFGISTTGIVLLDLPVWGVAAAAMGVFVVVLSRGAYDLWREASEGGFAPDLIKVPVVREIFRNERVEIDGKSFSVCEFNNVRLIYRGRAGFDFINPTLKGVSVDFDGDEALSGLLHLLSVLDFLHPRLASYHHDAIKGGGIGLERSALPGEEPPKGPVRLVDLLPRNDIVQRNRHFKGLTLTGPALILAVGTGTRFHGITLGRAGFRGDWVCRFPRMKSRRNQEMKKIKRSDRTSQAQSLELRWW